MGGTQLTTSSNVTLIDVAERLDAVLTIDSAIAAASPGETQQELVFTLTNTGNGTETFTLSGLSAGLPGDDFDPLLASPSLYFDTDSSGDLSPGDQAYVPGTNDPTLVADASVRILLVNDIPGTALDGQRGRSQLSIRAQTGTGSPGTSFDNLGDSGVHAVVGATGAAAETFGEYFIGAVQIQAIKSQTIADQFGGTRPLSGARINYQIVVTPAGAGTAANVVFSDLIPTHTTFVAGSLALNGAVQTDASDGDAGQYISAPQPQVRLTLGDLTAASGPQTVEFAVTID
jgi:uncharacterized repeat protein (TIGR01451 family)